MPSQKTGFLVLGSLLTDEQPRFPGSEKKFANRVKKSRKKFV